MHVILAMRVWHVYLIRKKEKVQDEKRKKSIELNELAKKSKSEGLTVEETFGTSRTPQGISG